VEESFLSAVEGVNDIRQAEIQTGEPHVPEPNAFEVKMATEKLKGQKSPGIDKILTELIKAGGRTVHTLRFVSLLILFGIRRNLPEEWKESIIVPIYKKGGKTNCSD
jgi:hypothetical protein